MGGHVILKIDVSTSQGNMKMNNATEPDESVIDILTVSDNFRIDIFILKIPRQEKKGNRKWKPPEDNGKLSQNKKNVGKLSNIN